MRAAVEQTRRQRRAARVRGDRSARRTSTRPGCSMPRTCAPPRPSVRIGRRTGGTGGARAGPGRPGAAQRFGLHRSADGVDARLRGVRGGHRPVQPARGPIPRTGWRWWRASGLVADGPDQPGRPPAPAGQRAALPGALLAPGGAGPPGAPATRSPPTRRTSIANGSRPPSTGSSRRVLRRRRDGPSATRRRRQRARSGRRCSPAAREPARPPRWLDCWPCSPTSPDRRRGSRWPHRPARPPPGWPRRCAEARDRRAEDGQRIARRSRPSTLHRLLGWLPGSGRGSAMTRTTSCRTTW